MRWVVSILALLCSAVQIARGDDAGPLVVVFSRTMAGTSSGNGFVVGDGTYVVTARHNVFPEQPGGLHQGDAFVTVLSPYLGEPCEADVVAQDRALDVIVLREAWRGHPALQLADEQQVLAAEDGALGGYSDVVSSVAAGKAVENSAPQTISLKVNSTTFRRGVSQTLVTDSPAPAGWAGAPFVLAGTNQVAGVYTRTQADGSAGVLAAAGAIRSLIPNMEWAPEIPADKSAGLAANLYLQSLAASAAKDSKRAFELVQRFLQLRPTSAIGYRDAAGYALALGRLDEAQNLYSKSLERNPQLISARILYAQLLQQRTMPAHAIEHLRYAATNGRGSTAAVIPLVNLLRDQGKEKECLDLLNDAVQKSPFDSYLWNYLGQSRAALKDAKGAATAFARSADLLPSNITPRMIAAEQFEAAGDIADAKAQAKLLITQHPDSARGHYYFARCLARDRANRKEAVHEAQIALNLSQPSETQLRQSINALIDALRTGSIFAGDQLRL